MASFSWWKDLLGRLPHRTCDYKPGFTKKVHSSVSGHFGFIMLLVEDLIGRASFAELQARVHIITVSLSLHTSQSSHNNSIPKVYIQARVHIITVSLSLHISQSSHLTVSSTMVLIFGFILLLEDLLDYPQALRVGTK